MLDDRKRAVLQAIVADYVHRREPVGSKALVERHQLGVSPATIRNDMAVLEEEGYIAAPHTSAGRIPTDKGYRLFVDQLVTLQPLSSSQRRAIHTFLAEPADLDDAVDEFLQIFAQSCELRRHDQALWNGAAEMDSSSGNSVCEVSSAVQ